MFTEARRPTSSHTYFLTPCLKNRCDNITKGASSFSQKRRNDIPYEYVNCRKYSTTLEDLQCRQ
jgi:hypothetical protein